MGSPLFAISELSIVAAAIWCTFRLTQRRMWLAAVGCAVLGAIAALGAYRYGFSQVTELADLHKSASQIGGAVAIIFIGAQFLMILPLVIERNFARVLVALSVWGSIFAIVTAPAIGMGLIVMWILVPIVATAYVRYESFATRFYLAALISIFLFNFLLVRQSSILGPIYSWHAYHTLIAIWLIALVYVLKRCLQRIEGSQI
ncbi:MAG: hypothetical protein ACI9LU_003192 [Polaribacter sp.]|jgi:hypothetical protein